MRALGVDRFWERGSYKCIRQRRPLKMSVVLIQLTASSTLVRDSKLWIIQMWQQ